MDDMEDDRHTQYRCSLYPILMLFRDIKDDLTQEHREIMMRTPFRHFLVALYEGRVNGFRKKDKALDQILYTYDKSKNAFKIGNGFHIPTRLDVKVMFGIVDGEEAIGDMKLKRGYAYDFGPRMFGKTGKITMAKVKAKAKAYVQYKDDRSREDTVKLLCLVLLQSFFLPNSSGDMPRGFLQYVDTFETMNRFDWSGKIHEYLIQGLTDKWTACSKIIGCTVFLMYWLVERSLSMHEALRRSDNAIPEGFKAVPRVCKWTLKEVEKLIMGGVLATEETIQFIGGELEATGEEVMLIDGLALEMDAMTVECLGNALQDMNPTAPNTTICRHDANKDVVGQVQQLCDNEAEHTPMLCDMGEDIDWSTPSFSLGLTQEMSGRASVEGEGRSTGHAVLVPDTPLMPTPHTVFHDKGKQPMHSADSRTHTLQLEVAVKAYGRSGDATGTTTPSSEYHTPYTVLPQQDYTEMGPSTSHCRTLQHKTFEQEPALTVASVRETEVNVYGIDNVQVIHEPEEVVQCGTEKEMLPRIEREPGSTFNVMDPSMSHCHISEHKIVEQEPAITVASVRETEVHVDGIGNVQVIHEPQEVLECGTDKEMLQCIEREPGSTFKVSSETHQQYTAQPTDVMREISNPTTGNACLGHVSSSAAKNLEELAYKHGRLEAYAIYLEQKLDLFYNEVSKHGMDDEAIMNAHMATSTCDIGRGDDVADLRNQLLEQRNRIANLEGEMEEQAAVIKQLIT